jgi:hypothetical protein
MSSVRERGGSNNMSREERVQKMVENYTRKRDQSHETPVMELPPILRSF